MKLIKKKLELKELEVNLKKENKEELHKLLKMFPSKINMKIKKCQI